MSDVEKVLEASRKRTENRSKEYDADLEKVKAVFNSYRKRYEETMKETSKEK